MSSAALHPPKSLFKFSTTYTHKLLFKINLKIHLEEIIC